MYYSQNYCLEKSFWPIRIENVTALCYKAVTDVYVSKHSLLYVTPFSFKPHWLHKVDSLHHGPCIHWVFYDYRGEAYSQKNERPHAAKARLKSIWIWSFKPVQHVWDAVSSELQASL